ncbi:MAG: 3-oxoacyl-[acyl-carrier-protein] reductase [Bacteroidetes bacterium]|nr:3-oxoacyl-[acyl-carrier-protein] reductase [Bacteroidota bacterium]
MQLLSGKTALITGASRGIGKTIAICFAKQGADIAFSDIGPADKVAEFENELAATGVKAKSYLSDASDFKQSAELVESVASHFGRLDILVNNAGITRDTLLMRMSEEQWDLVLKVNLKSVFNLTRAAQSIMMKQRSGSIINMASVVGIKGNAGQANYSASKAGIIGFTKSIALELGSRNIRCNAIAPGFIETDMTKTLDPKIMEGWKQMIPLKRTGTPEDVANLALFLASDLSAYITGQVIQVDGGMVT